MSKQFKIVCISDTHMRHEGLVIPECDILIHAGDATNYGDLTELMEFAEWLNEQEAAHIIFVPGNHEIQMEKNLQQSINILKNYCPAINILINETIDIEGIKIHGSPCTPWYGSWGWNRARSDEEAIFRNIKHIKHDWDLIPLNVDVLITHGPAYKVLDMNREGEHCGCYNLMATIVDLRPKIHICGHIHEGYGYEHYDGVDFYNVSICNRQYLPINPITVIDYVLE